MFRRVAEIVVQILNGAKPGDLPLEQPTKLEFVVNLKVAKAIGLTKVASLFMKSVAEAAATQAFRAANPAARPILEGVEGVDPPR
jgi:ABC-type uncharacterized transport system substrate-binding protein